MPFFVQASLVLLVLAAAAYDIRFRKIPNWLNLSGVILGVGLNCFFLGRAGLLLAISGCGLALLIYFPLFLARGMGAGDVKLMAAVGALAGPRNWLYIFLVTALLGGVAAIILILRKQRLLSTLANVGVIVGELSHARAPYRKDPGLDVRAKQSIGLPHGAVIAAGSIVFLLLVTLAVATP